MRRRADIIVQGEVKEAGYRAYIMKMAERNKLVGFVENLPNRAVHIVCEGEEEDIDSFLEQIGAEMDFVEIEGIERELTEPTGEFNVFEVKVQDMAYELFQGFATSRKYFGWLGDKMDKGFTGLGDKMDKGFTGLGDKMDKGFTGLGDKMDKGFTGLGDKMDKGFTGLGDKMDTVGEKVDSVGREVRELKEVTIQGFKKLDERYHIIAQNLERLSINIEKMAESLIILVKNHIEREESKG